MGIQYVTDEQGNHVAVQVPIAEWEAIQERIKEPNAETIAAMEEARHPEKLESYATPEAMWATPIEDFGMTPAEGKETRSHLEAFAPDWDSPDMDAYDNYDAARQALETR
jgi:hypothetical protein